LGSSDAALGEDWWLTITPLFAAEASSAALPHPEFLPVSSMCKLNYSLLLLVSRLISFSPVFYRNQHPDQSLIRTSIAMLAAGSAADPCRGVEEKQGAEHLCSEQVRRSRALRGVSTKSPSHKPCALSAALGRWELWRRCCTPPDRSCRIAVRIAPT
jgi:hypothetical protein